jgi:hypothetical protein
MRSDDGFAWYREFVTRNTVPPLMEAAAAPSVTTTRGLMHRKRLMMIPLARPESPPVFDLSLANRIGY